MKPKYFTLAFLAVLLVATVVYLNSGLDKSSKANGEDKLLKVGVFLLASHPVIFDLRDGFNDMLKKLALENNIEIEFDEKNAEGDGAQLNQLAAYFTRGRHDIVYSVGAPATLKLMSRELTGPVLFAGVPDPVRNGFVKSLEKPSLGITGARFLPPADVILDVIQRANPGIKRIAVLRNPSEINSVATAEPLIAEAKKRSIEVEDFGITESNQLKVTLNRIISGNFQVLFIPTDNLVYQNLKVVIEAASRADVSVVSVTDVAVKMGADFSIGIPYYEVGEATAEMAFDIMLNNKSSNDVPVRDISRGYLFVAPEQADRYKQFATEAFPVKVVE